MMPFFVMGLLVVVDFGILMYEYISVSNASREAARYGSVSCTVGACNDQLIRDYAIKKSSGILPVGSPDAVIMVRSRDREDLNSTTRDKGDSVIVQIKHRYKFLFIPLWEVNVGSCADMRLEKTESTGTVTSTTTLAC
jgi:hypothetical protein